MIKDNLPRALFALTFLISGVNSVYGANLEDCFTKALHKSYTVELQKEAVDLAREKVTQARAGFFPTVGASLGLLSQTTSSNVLAAQMSPPNQQTSKISLSQSLFRGFRDMKGVDKALSSYRSQGLVFEDSKRLLYQEVANEFYNILILESDVRFTTEIFVLNMRKLTEMVSFLRLGKTKQLDVVRLRAELAGLNAQIQLLKGLLNGEREAFEVLTGVKQEELLEVKTTAFEVPLPGGEALYLKKLLESMQGRPDLTASRLNIEAADHAVSISRASYFPNVDFQGNYYFQRPGVLSDINWDVQLLATFSFSTGNLVQSQVRESLHDLRTHELNHLNRKSQVEQEVRKLYQNFLGQKAQISSLSEMTDLAEQELILIRSDFKNGEVTTADILVAQAKLEASRRTLARANFEHQLLFIQLRLAANEWPREDYTP